MTRGHWRKRVFLLLLAVLPQVLSFGGLAGLFWVLRIKEVFTGAAVFEQQNDQATMQLYLAPKDRPKLEVGSRLHATILSLAGEPQTDLQAEVIKISKAGPGAPAPWRVSTLVSSPIPQKLLARGPVQLSGWSRTRRAFTVLFGERGLFKGRRMSPAPQLTPGAVP